MKFCTGATLRRLVYLAGFCFFTSSLILTLFWQNLFDAFIRTQFQLNPSSLLYNIWMNNQVPIRLEIYLFNLTNAEKFERDKSTIPNFEEVGPFFFEEIREKIGVSWNDSEQTVTFNQSKTWLLMPELSRDFSVRVTNFNPVASTIAYASRLWSSELQRKIVNTLLNIHEPLLTTASAREWIFTGISDEFLDMIQQLKKVAEIPIPYNKFGWFYERNGSSSFDGAFTIKTGASSMDDLGMMAAWNGRNKTDHYVDSCALVRGSTGEIIPPLKAFQENLPLFASDICSYITLKFERSVDVEGLSAYEYAGDKTVFDNGTSNPENSCFYLGESCPSGLRNVSSCRFGSPAFISFPHFYLADAHYLEKLTGMNPDESKHKFTLKVEPKSGVPLAVEAPLQINFLVDSYAWCDEFREVPRMYVPMLWFKQTVRIPHEYSRALRAFLFVKSSGAFLLFFLASFIFFCVLFWRQRSR